MSSGSEWRPSFNPWLVAISVMLATFMEVLDTSVANVSLPHIAGNLSATTDEATWVLTSYLVANALILPATGWLGRRFGRKRFLLTCILIFTGASFLAGGAPTLGWLIAARVLQGAGGGALQPIAQAVLLESFPPHKRGQAMAFFGMGIVVAPILGPTLGGWITDNFSWRWIFFINLPVGLLAVAMGRRFIEDPPWIRNAVRTSLDYTGFGFMALWLACQEIVLDKGQEADWLGAPYIVWLMVFAVVGLIGFVWWEMTVKEPLVNLRVLGNINFAAGTMLIFMVGVVLYGLLALLPLMMQTLMGYPALQSGLAMSPRGIGSILAMPIVGRLVGRVDSRAMIVFGWVGLAISGFWFAGLTLDVSMASVVMPNLLCGFSVAFIFVPLTTLAVATLSPEEIGNATGLYNLMRNIGGSVGISWLDTLVERGSQTHQALMVGHLSTLDSPFAQAAAGLQHALAPALGAAQTAGPAYQVMLGLLQQQATLQAYLDDFRYMGFAAFACVVLVLLFRHGEPRKGEVFVH